MGLYTGRVLCTQAVYISIDDILGKWQLNFIVNDKHENKQEIKTRAKKNKH